MTASNVIDALYGHAKGNAGRSIGLVIPNFFIRKATMDDCGLLFRWRNEQSTREASFNSEPVEYNFHCKWLENSLNNQDLEIFIAYIENTPVGTCRLDYSPDHKSAEVSWTIGGHYRNNHYSIYMLALLFGQTKANEYIAKIKHGNLASQGLAAKFGFKITEEFNGGSEWRMRVLEI